MSLIWNFQIIATAPKQSVTSSQHYESNATVPVFGIVCVYRHRNLDTSDSGYWLQVWRDSGMEQADFAEITGTLCKLREKLNICCMNGSDLRRRSTCDRMLRSWVQIPPDA